MRKKTPLGYWNCRTPAICHRRWTRMSKNYRSAKSHGRTSNGCAAGSQAPTEMLNIAAYTEPKGRSRAASTSTCGAARRPNMRRGRASGTNRSARARSRRLWTDFLEGDWPAKSDRFVLCVQASLRSTAIDKKIEECAAKLRERGIEFLPLDGEQLSERLKSFPANRLRFLRARVGRTLLRQGSRAIRREAPNPGGIPRPQSPTVGVLHGAFL